ncbi:MAG: PIG-L family deacetylase [Candidatus Eisenbacteria bacterium]|uniref:PIG-L family deacetylase n=1 Tax=Eiseniibacteriota bacterium TaxID=2212470 RepID=A0A956M2F1_UNCEI|nr:PIG-L family deacetylase [Candidatus Eisenbacteria bacterium]
MAEQFDVVVFGPHPDDIEMSIAGTLIKLVRSGKRVLTISLTRGEKGTYGTPETRRREFEAANAVMGTTGRMLDFPDTGVTNDYEGKLKIARIVREAKPRVVFAPYHTNPFGHHDGSANVDHYATGLLARDGLKLARFVNVMPELPPHDVPFLYYYMVPKHLSPTVVVDVSDVIEDVWRAIEAYETQMAIHRAENKILDLLSVLRRYHGIRISAKYGEPFLSDEAIPFGPEEFFGPRD